jgi:hypothetical protein
MADAFFSLFELDRRRRGAVSRLVVRPQDGALPATVPCPETGRPLKVASVEVSERGVCPACATPGAGGYVSFVSDLRLAFACPSCRKLVFLAGT